jgi:hypothetical protein
VVLSSPADLPETIRLLATIGYAHEGDLGIVGGFNATALWVLRDNLRTRRFYEHFGGKVIAEREDARDGTVLIELAYGWPDLKEFCRLLARE